MIYKILFGIPAQFVPKFVPKTEKGYIEDYDVDDPYADIWCDFCLGYDYKDDFYYLEFETFLGFEKDGGCREWVEHCLLELEDYMKRHGYDTSKELNMYDVFTEGVNVRSNFKSIEDAYAFLKFAVHGFHGDGIEMVERSLYFDE